MVRLRAFRAPKYDGEVVGAGDAGRWWTLRRATADPILGDPVPVLRGHGELDIGDHAAVLLIAMSAATIHRRLAHAQPALVLKARLDTTPGSVAVEVPDAAANLG